MRALERQWTKEQQYAITASGKGALTVSAAAGSGKTAVLVERVIRKVCNTDNPCGLDRLLIVTYTKPAAAEMKERIGSAIAQKLAEDPQNPFLLRQQAMLSRANISTIDSFCSSLVREFFYLTDLSSDFRIADSGELELIKAHALELTLSRFYSGRNPDFYRLAKAFSTSKNDKNLEKTVLKLYEFLCSHPFYDTWLSQKLAYYCESADPAETVWGKNISDYAESALEYALSLCRKNSALSQSDSVLSAALHDFLNTVQAGISHILSKLQNKCGWNELRNLLLNFKLPRFPTIKNYKDNPTKLVIHANHTSISELLKKLCELFSFDSGQINEQLSSLRPIMGQLFECVREFSREYSNEKRSKNIADFSDLEHYALNLLVDETENGYAVSELSKQISERFDEVMVDEYQDANEVQDAIFNAVSAGGKNLFVVGDVKQSIYSFRQAMPEIFMARKKASTPYREENPVFPACVVLGKNFRSRFEITESVNFIFKKLMTVKTGDIDYTDEEKLTSGAHYPETDEACVDFVLIDQTKCGTDSADSAEAEVIAQKILKMKKDGVTVMKNGVPCVLEYGDIAVLMRSPKKSAPVFASVLKAYGIPVSCERTENFFEAFEVRALLNLLRVIGNPLQDIPLAAVMMSALYGFTADDIAHIRTISPKAPLYSAVLTAQNQLSDGLKDKITAFLDEIADFRTYSVTVSIHRLINRIFEQTAFASVMSAGKADSSVENNLNIFCEYAASYENSGRRGLSSFVHYMDGMEENGLALTAAASENEGLNCVHIMSIHKSKGLEFPVCFLANTAKQFNLQDLRERVLVHSKLGVASKLYSEEMMCYTPSLAHKSLALELKRNLCSEELRVLYVALTRPKERLIITACVKDAQKAIINAASKIINSSIPPFNVQNCESFSVWLLACALLHPDGHILRKAAQFEDYEIPEGEIPKWDFEIVNSLAQADDAELAQKLGTAPKEHTDGCLLENLKLCESFEYPLRDIANLPVKVSASELAHSKAKSFIKTTLSKPLFLSDKKFTAAQKGTAVHKFLQICDFNNAKEDIGSEIRRLYDCGKLTEQEVSAVEEKNPAPFFGSEFAREILSSPQIYREFEFMVSVDASLIDPQIKPPFDKRQVLMQGTVDLAYMNPDGTLTVIDYKTDRISDVSVLAQRYEIQISLYRNAMEQSVGCRVSRCILYSIHLGKSIEIKLKA